MSGGAVLNVFISFDTSNCIWLVFVFARADSQVTRWMQFDLPNVTWAKINHGSFQKDAWMSKQLLLTQGPFTLGNFVREAIDDLVLR